MQKLMCVATAYRLENSDLKEINKFLQENPTWQVASIVPIMQHRSSGNANYGIVVVLDDSTPQDV